jgi:hypothetical protein
MLKGEYLAKPQWYVQVHTPQGDEEHAASTLRQAQYIEVWARRCAEAMFGNDYRLDIATKIVRG